MEVASKDFRHSVPDDLRAVLDNNKPLEAKWDGLTDLARLEEEVLAGKRRPCCWPGCPHRRASARKYFKS